MVDSKLYNIVRVALVLTAFLYVLLCRKISMETVRSIGLAVAVAIVYCLIYAAAVGYNTMWFCFTAICAATIYAFIQAAVDKDRGGQLFIKYKDLIVIIAVVSLFFWLFGSMLGMISPSGYLDITWGSEDGSRLIPSYFGLYFETQSVNSFLGVINTTVCRNTAIFTEAPMFNFHLCMALIIELFYCKKISQAKCAILILAILSTFSTTGYCMMIIVLVAKYIFSKKVTGFLKTLKVVIVPCLVVVGVILFLTLISYRLGTSSGSARVSDFVTGFQAWLKSPLFGYGYGSELYYNSVKYGFSNSITQILGYGGIFLAIPYFYFMVKWVCRCVKERDMEKFLMFVCFMFLFAITIVADRFLTMFFLFASCIPRQKEQAECSVAVRWAYGNVVKNES